MKFTQGCVIRPIEKKFAAAALFLCLFSSFAVQAVDVSDTARDQSRSPTSTYSGTKWEVRAGDTLAGIARSIYPDNAPIRDKLIRAIIAANPDVFPDGKSVHLAVGSALTIPDLRTLSAAETPGTKTPTDKSKFNATSKATASAASVAPATPVTTAISKQIKPVADSPSPPPPPPPAPQEQTTPGKLTTGSGFGLKLSAAILDLSVIGKLSEEELKRRREGQLLLEIDDPAASFLVLKRRIKHLETQVEELQLKLDLGKNRASLPAPAAPATVPAGTKPAPSASSAASIPFIPAAYTPAPTNDTLALIKYALTLYLLPAAEITLALLALFFVLRYYRNLRARLAESGELAAAAHNERLSVIAKAREATADISHFDKNLAISTAAHIEVVEDTDTILQDAQLFVIHGYPDKAIELLEHQVATNHEEVRVWMLLFVILRSQGMKEEFEKYAQRFRTLINVQSMWENIQDLGRELDSANPLYFNKRNRRVANTSAPNAAPETKASVPAPNMLQEFKVVLDVSQSASTKAPPDKA